MMTVFSNLAMSLDGKIATADRGHFPLGTEADRRQMQVLRAEADVIIMGASTLRAYRRPCRIQGLERTSDRQPANAVVSTRLEGISPTWPFFKDQSLRRVIFITGSPTGKALREFEGTCRVVRLAPRDRAAPAQAILRALAKAGYRRALLEGGGSLVWEFASANLIDEYHVTVTPRILGGATAPTLVDGSGFKKAKVLNLDLTQCRIVGNELFLVYRNTDRRGARVSRTPHSAKTNAFGRGATRAGRRDFLCEKSP